MSNTDESNVITDIDNVSSVVEEPGVSLDIKPETPTPAPTLTIGILTQVRNILDALIARGAVRPNEMSTVGQVYDQYSAGLNHLIQMSQASNEQQSSENTSA